MVQRFTLIHGDYLSLSAIVIDIEFSHITKSKSIITYGYSLTKPSPSHYKLLQCLVCVQSHLVCDTKPLYLGKRDVIPRLKDIASRVGAKIFIIINLLYRLWGILFCFVIVLLYCFKHSFPRRGITSRFPEYIHYIVSGVYRLSFFLPSEFYVCV